MKWDTSWCVSTTIKERFWNKVRKKVLCAEFGVCLSVVSKIINNKIWRHI